MYSVIHGTAVATAAKLSKKRWIILLLLHWQHVKLLEKVHSGYFYLTSFYYYLYSRIPDS